MIRAFQELNEDNFDMFAIRHYSNPQCLDVKEFYDDLNRFKYIRKLLRRYDETGQLQERLVLNHLIVLCNVFPDPVSINRMLFYKLVPESWPILKTFLLFLNRINPGTYEDVPIDLHVALRLKTI